MDVHPTPFPGKRRPASNPTTKDGERIKSSKKPTSQILTAAPTRPKRAFGVARSANVPVEKSLSKPSSTQTCKPWKPSGNAAKPVKKDAPAVAVSGKDRKVDENVAGGESGKTKTGTKKHQHVSFQDPVAGEAAADDDGGGEKIAQQEGICTPMSSIKSAAVGTPYHSAQNCSKCRLDKLESATYWLAQIKLAESAGRHSVAAAFFRLALECQAQPFLKLQMELKHYAARHGVGSAESLLTDLSKAYGLSDAEASARSCNLDKFDAIFAEKEEPKPDAGEELTICEANKDGCLEHDGDDNPVLDEAEEEPVQDVDAHTAELKGGAVKEELTEEKPALKTSSEDPFPENKNSEAMIISHVCADESLEENASGKRSCGEKSNRGKGLPMKGSSLNARTQRSGSAGKGRSSAKKNEAGLKFSVGEQMRTHVKDGGKRDGSGRLRSKDKEDLKGDNFSSDVFGEDAMTHQNA